MTDHTANITIRTDPDLPGLTRTYPEPAGFALNKSGILWTNLDKIGQIWTFPDTFSANSQLTAANPPGSPRIPPRSPQPSLRRRPRLHHVHWVAPTLGRRDVVPLRRLERA